MSYRYDPQSVATRWRLARMLSDVILHAVERLRGGLDEIPVADQTTYLRAVLDAVRAILAPTGQGLSYAQLMGRHGPEDEGGR